MDLTSWILFPLYVLQLENYELGRFWRVLARRGFTPAPRPWRKKLVFTKKLILVAALSEVQHLAIIYFALQFASVLWVILVAVIFGSFLYAILVSISVMVLWPVDFLAKHALLWRARQKLQRLPNLKIVGIAGSYGKTTVKDMIAAVLSKKYTVLVTPENINTPLGIARLVLESLVSTTEIFVVEMGEYYRGDIKDICALTPPDIAVVTGINEAHLERLKNLENTTTTIFEVVTYAKQNASLVLNADDARVVAGAQKFIAEHTALWYSSVGSPGAELVCKNYIFQTDGSGQGFVAQEKGNQLEENFKIKFLGEYAVGSALCAAQIGLLLGISLKTSAEALSTLKPIEHRLEPLPSTGNVLVIDDSYNGNPAGVSQAIGVLARFTTRRKLFITPGLVEMGKSAPSIHKKIGEELSRVADGVILIKNSVTPFIAAGLLENGFAKEKIIWFNTALEAHGALKTILKPSDVILFQNDWGDNYV